MQAVASKRGGNRKDLDRRQGKRTQEQERFGEQTGGGTRIESNYISGRTGNKATAFDGWPAKVHGRGKWKEHPWAAA